MLDHWILFRIAIIVRWFHTVYLVGSIKIFHNSKNQTDVILGFAILWKICVYIKKHLKSCLGSHFSEQLSPYQFQYESGFACFLLLNWVL